MVWNGSTWRTLSPPAFSTVHELYGVDTSGPTTAWAVGDRATSAGGYRTLTERWNGTAWTDLGGPNITAADNYLRGVAITPGTSSNVWAVGYAIPTGSLDAKPLILHYF
jgi:hypothetical protein